MLFLFASLANGQSGGPSPSSTPVRARDLGVPFEGTPGRLNAITDVLVQRLAVAARSCDIPLATNHVCGMFGFFFTEERRVDSFAKVMACDLERFKRFFHRMLEEGVYFAPSAFETGFVSAAHSPADIDATIAAALKTFSSLRS